MITRFFPSLSALCIIQAVHLASPSHASSPWQHTEQKRHPAPEARQAVAVGPKHFFAIDNTTIGKYRRSDGKKVAEWSGSGDARFVHLNSGTVRGGKLYCAHSHYPSDPDRSSVEIWSHDRLEHIESIPLSDAPGSLTWILPYRHGWLACFVHYPNRSDPKKSCIVHYDVDWNEQQRWHFPEDLLARFDRYSCSGAAFGPGGHLYLTGHDAQELYMVELPQEEERLAWKDTVPMSAKGQGVDWAPENRSLLYGIDRQSKEVVVSNISGPFEQETTLDAAPDGSFTMVVIPDTQRYMGRGTKHDPESTAPVTNDVLERHVDWIEQNRETQRIIFVSHVGDIVDRNVPEQWEVARQHLSRLQGLLPHALVVGNHDMKASGDSSLFQKHFGAAAFRSYPWYGGTFEPDPPTPGLSSDNANSYQLFEAGEHRFLHLALECNAPDNVLAWAGQLLSRHEDRTAIISTHMDLGVREKPTETRGHVEDPKGRMRWKKNHGSRGNTPEQLWDKLYRHHPHLLLVFSGDQSRTTAMHVKQTGDHGNTVHSLLSDYTSSGPLRLYRFLPQEQRIAVITYDTTLQRPAFSTSLLPERDSHHFSIPWQFNNR